VLETGVRVGPVCEELRHEGPIATEDRRVQGGVARTGGVRVGPCVEQHRRERPMATVRGHDNKGLPFVLVGGGSGQLAPGGRHIKAADETPVTNLHLTILDKMGVPVDTMSDSTGKLELLSVG